jgi:hypothetical protein
MLSEQSCKSTDLTFVTKEPGNNLRDRFNTLLTKDTSHFDCLGGYFYISGFSQHLSCLENVEKVRILGLQTDRAAYELSQQAGRDGELNLSHKSTKEKVSQDVLDELEKRPMRSLLRQVFTSFSNGCDLGNSEIEAYASENLHAKVYIMTFSVATAMQDV